MTAPIVTQNLRWPWPYEFLDTPRRHVAGQLWERVAEGVNR